MNKTRLFKKSLLAVTITTATLASQQAFAAGFQLNAQSATGIGRAFAGDAVIADNASVMARNPAAMALFDKTALSLGFEVIQSDIEFKDGTYTNAHPATTPTASSHDDAGDTSIAPNIHLIVPLNEKFAVGVNAYTNFGTKTDFTGQESFYGSEYGGETEIVSMNFGLAGSYRLNEQWSVGAGIDFIYGQGTLKRNFDDSFDQGIGGPLAGLEALAGQPALDVEDADGWGIGFNLGAVYEHNENNRFGLAYRYSPEIDADDGNQTVHLPLPDIAEFSGYHRIEDTKFAVHYSIQWINWSDFDTLKFSGLDQGSITGDYSTEYQWQDGWHYAIGGTYYLNSDWTLRAGYMYDTSAQDKITSVSVPDSDRQWFSAGFTYHINQDMNVDFGFTYLKGDDVNVNQTTPHTADTAPLGGDNLSEISGTTRADAILFGLQYSQTF